MSVADLAVYTLPFAVLAAWDVGRRYFRDRADARASFNEERSDLNKRVKELESNQRELLLRVSQVTKLSRFQRNG